MYDADYSELFIDKINSPEFANFVDTGKDIDIIRDKCNLIREQPFTACKSERLKYKYSGKRSGRLSDKPPFRIIYMFCAECVKAGDLDRNKKDCPGCDGKSRNLVRFIDIINYHQP